MATIIVHQKEKKDGVALFAVTVLDEKSDSKTVHEVELTDEYWKRLTEARASQEDLVHESFVFLLEKEPKESILSAFNLKKIQEYFPDYEGDMMGTFRSAF